MSTQADTHTQTLVERFSLKTLVEACLLIEEGVCEVKDAELGMMAGAGILPGPFARADERGLDEVLDALLALESSEGTRFSPPTLLRRLVAQNRLGKKTGQGFFPYPNPDEENSLSTCALEWHTDIAIIWLNRPPTNPISPKLVDELAELWQRAQSARCVVLCSSSPFTFSAGADIKEFTQMSSETQGRQLLDRAHGLLTEMEQAAIPTIACVNALAYGGGCELAMACDLRIAARSASFCQPEIDLGIIPGFGGTQRLRRLVGEGKALEMCLSAEAIDAQTAAALGLVNEVCPDHELFDTAFAWARALSQKPPIAIAQIKRASAQSDFQAGIEAEKQGFVKAFASHDAQEGIQAFLTKRPPRFEGR
jgi:enoyl-CoA hydratase / 3-hydroxyacyl-CoA dehydrogenase